jgi:hypothetical protein
MTTIEEIFSEPNNVELINRELTQKAKSGLWDAMQALFWWNGKKNTGVRFPAWTPMDFNVLFNR